MTVSFDFKKRLGSGYFGEVWHAIDTGLNAECALKCIPRDKVINQDNFFQEAQVLKAAEHANIVQVKDTGELADGRIYVAMEYLKHGSLEDEASGGLIKLSRARQLMIDLLRGLQYAHSQSIVHRDIKPANILIGDAKEGKLSDFGLALPDFSKLNLSSVKQYQYILHLAPEVAKFTDYDFLSDIYACGVTFYRLVNGDNYLPPVPPNVARSMAISGQFPDRSKYRSFVPRNFRQVINTALNVDPSSRYQSAEEMRRAIERLVACIDWEEDIVSSGTRWRGENDKAHEILLYEDASSKTWGVEVKRGRTYSSLRRVTDLCKVGMKQADALKFASKLMQDHVTGKV